MRDQIDSQNLPKGIRLYTIEDVMRAWNMSRSKIYRIISQGSIRVVKIEGSTRFIPSDVENFIKDNTY